MQNYFWVASYVCVVPESGEVAFDNGVTEVALHARALLHCVLVILGALA